MEGERISATRGNVKWSVRPRVTAFYSKIRNTALSITRVDFDKCLSFGTESVYNTRTSDYSVTACTWNQMAFPQHVFPDHVGL